VPGGRYLVGGQPETFRCAAGPAGWRYTGSRTGDAAGLTVHTDLTVDSTGRQRRVELRRGEHLLRGGLAGAGELRWVRDGRESVARAAGFAGDSPGFLVAAARLLRLEPGQSRRLRLVLASGPALATRTVDVRWSCLEQAEQGTDLGPLRLTRYQVVPLDTGEPRTVYLAGDVVVAADGVELAELDAPPGQ
jgi:hypothetical protein